jgi:serine protease Do
MNPSPKSHPKTRNRLLGAAAAIAIASAIGLGAVTGGTAPVLADAVKVDAPQQAPSFANVVEKVTPAVVSVQVKSDVAPASDNGGMPDIPGFDNLPDNHPLKRFFRDYRGGDQQQRRAPRRSGPRPVAQGSGFFISEDGYLVTNNHVVADGSAYTVVMNDGTELDAKLIGTDERTDLAVLKVDSDKKFTYVAFADDSSVRVGDWVVAVGNPFGLGGTVTAGIVSARGRDIGAGPYDDFLQIDAAVNRGNSGGPAFDLNGQVVGVNTAIFSPSGGNVGIAFAIPASTVKDVVAQLRDSGTVERGWLGVQIQPVSPDIAESLGLGKPQGALVSEPQEDSPAGKAGIVSGDVILSVDGKDVASPRELARLIAGINPDKSVELGVWHNGSTKTVEVKLGKMPGSEQHADAGKRAAPAANTLDDFGLTVTPSENGKGLVVTDVDSGSLADERGIQPGDVIVSVNSADVGSARDVTKAVDAASKAGRKAVLMRVEREDTSRFVALPLAG